MTSFQAQQRRDDRMSEFLSLIYGAPSAKYSVKYHLTPAMNNTVHPVIFENSTGRYVPLTHNKNGKSHRVVRFDLYLDRKNFLARRPSYLKLDFSQKPVYPLNSHQRFIPLPASFDALLDTVFRVL